MEILFITVTCIFVIGTIFFGGRLLLLAGNSIFKEQFFLTKYQGISAYLNYKNLLPLIILIAVSLVYFLVDRSFIIQSAGYIFLCLGILLLGNFFKLLIWDNRNKIDDILTDNSFKLIFVGIFFSVIFSCIWSSSYQNNIAPNTNASYSNAPFNTTKTPVAPKTNDAPTITPVVQAYYAALKKKDDAALKKVMTQEFIKSLEADMKSEGGTSLAVYAAELEDLTKPVEVRNEKIEGDKATAELKGGTYVNWTTFEFAKENGEWKFTGKTPDATSVKQSVSNSNKAK